MKRLQLQITRGFLISHLRQLPGEQQEAGVAHSLANLATCRLAHETEFCWPNIF